MAECFRCAGSLLGLVSKRQSRPLANFASKLINNAVSIVENLRFRVEAKALVVAVAVDGEAIEHRVDSRTKGFTVTR